MDTDSFVFLSSPNKCLIEDLKHFSKDLYLSERDPSHELVPKHNMKVVGKVKLESSPEFGTDEAVFFEG